MNLNPVEKARQRILLINWKYDDPYKEGSHRLLFDEFLRRSAMLAKAVGLLDDSENGWLMYDYAVFFDSSLELEEEEIDALAAELQVNGYPSWYAERVCVYFLHWVAVENHPDVVEQTLLNPYEPLIMLYERGGTFRRDKDGTWEFTFTAFFIDPPGNYLSRAPVVDLNDESLLDSVDEEFEKSRKEELRKYSEIEK
jgi:hypothetical protein